ncbi:Alkaline-phosphatase-like, core domain [Phytophthora cactorum]|nr:Alkaline-phosphatase-like, core domain [Phytophthora cactorum]
MESHLSTRYRVADLLADDVAASNLEASQTRRGGDNLDREREHLKDAPITEEEINTSYVNAVGLMMVATFFGLVRVYADWTDLSRWNPTHMVLSLLVPKLVHLETRSNKCIYKNAVQHVEPNLEEGNGNTSNAEDTHSLLSSVKTTVVSISCASSPVVAYSALNATLNELFANALLPAPPQLTRSNELSDQPWVEMFIHHTKKHELFRNHSLYRRTTGFRGELAFDVDVKSDNPPNVLVIGVESFASKTRATSWAKRGVAFRKIWSSNPTSRCRTVVRSVRTTAPARTGITGGAKNTNLTGMPQIFTQKGYETWFTTGSSIDLDGWDIFLPSHGFDTVWDNKKMMELAEGYLGITHETGLPDFSVFYEGQPHADMIRRYLEVRYFSDMELGKFMDRMANEGILNDTIVIITGDHGQAPEADVTNTHEESMTRVAAAIIAEGRLGDAVGLMIEDTVEHYDFLNTLADITGVPEGGFLQNGVGRSLKRKVPFGERVVFSNEPNRKMAIVRGHQRLRYDQASDSMMLHDTESDHAMNIDLFPNLTAEAQAEWRTWRDNGRRLAAYYTKGGRELPARGELHDRAVTLRISLVATHATL